MPRPCFNETVSLWGHTDPAYVSCPIQKFLNVPRSQIPGEKPPHLVLFSNSQPGWRTYSHVLPPAKHWSCVFRSQHLHCTYVPGKSILTAHVIISNYLLPGPCCSGGTSSPEPFLQSQALPQPHLCKGIHLHQERERESSKSLQVGTAVPSPASEESWSLGKRSGRVITGCIWTSNCRDTPASEVTVGSSVHLVGTQYVPCFYKYKDI